MARAMAREFVAGFDDHDAANVYLAISEVVTNAVVHGPGDDVTVRLIRTWRGLRVEVCDAGTERWALPIWSDPERAHGLELVDAFTDRCGVEFLPQTLVWFELDVDS